MSGPIFKDSEIKDKFSPENVERHNKEIRAKANPLVQSMMDEVQVAVDKENEELATRLEYENQLRAWARGLLGVSLTISQIEDLRDLAQNQPSSTIFNYLHFFLVKTPFGTLDLADRYLFTLEKQIIILSQKSEKKFTLKSIVGSIKKIFNQILKRSS